MDDNHETITALAQETAEIGKRYGHLLMRRKGRPGPVILCLYGDLGSGKTTFTQGFAQGLGITTRLLSPTFIIVRRYEIPSTEKFLYHIDLYRLKNADEMEELGLTEIFTDPTAVVVIEWADRLGDTMPGRREDIHFEVLGSGTHKITVRKVTT